MQDKKQIKDKVKFMLHQLNKDDDNMEELNLNFLTKKQIEFLSEYISAGIIILK